MDLHSPQKMIIFAPGKVGWSFPFFMPCCKRPCNKPQNALSFASDERVICVRMRGDMTEIAH